MNDAQLWLHADIGAGILPFQPHVASNHKANHGMETISGYIMFLRVLSTANDDLMVYGKFM
jgi:hypothetical protein